MRCGSRFFPVRFLPWLTFLLLCVTSFVLARADTASDLLAPGDWQLAAPHAGDASLTMLPTGASTHGDVVRLAVKVPCDPVWLIQVTRGISADVPEGHRIHLHFWARSATSNPLRVTVEQPYAPYQGVCGGMIDLTPQWQEFNFSGPTAGFGPNGLSVHFQAGRKAGMVEIAGTRVTDTGPEPVPASVRHALQADQIKARIEKYREGELTVKVEDATGRPLPGATVKITETHSAFLFGANFFALNPADTSSLQQTYQNEFTALFNYATLPFYWGAFEPEQGHPDYDRLEKMCRWGLAHGLTLKGHPLIYHQVWPAWAPTDPDAAIPLLQARLFDLIPHFKDLIHYWDVLNEANSAADYSPANGESSWIHRDGPATVVGTALDWARTAREAAGTTETFIYNDYETGPSNVDLLAKLRTAGKLPDVIGLQAHMHTGNWPLAKTWQVCETFARFGKPIHLTECTVLSGPKRLHSSTESDATDWNSTPEDEAKQAEYVAQFYTLLFSHPALRAISWWDLSDKYAWMGAPGGLVRKDMSPKPAYTRLMDLIHHQWWTNTQGSTDGAGMFVQRVFYGDYQVTVTEANGRAATQTIHFPEAAAPLSVTIHMP
jgi:endo-1,4-beta-xylanase